MMRCVLLLMLGVGLFLPAPTLVAQAVSAIINPNPATTAQAVAMTITAAEPIHLPSSCAFSVVRADSPTGPVVPPTVPCLAVITSLAPGQSLTQTWTPASTVGTGHYWFQVDYWDAGWTTVRSEFFCFEIRDPSSLSPVLAQVTPAQQGQDLILSMSAPLFAGAPYLAAASLTSNTGIQLGFNTLCLDRDFVFDLSYPAPHPQLFSGFVGSLDANGFASGMTVHIPVLPALDHRPLHVLAVVGSGAAFSFSNGLSFTIAP